MSQENNDTEEILYGRLSPCEDRLTTIATMSSNQESGGDLSRPLWRQGKNELWDIRGQGRIKWQPRAEMAI